jgi:hypothetical protein
MELVGERPAKKSAHTMTYTRRSERIKRKQDGARLGSVEQASQRKANSAGESDSSVGSASTRRRKGRRLPDINKIAPLPGSACPPETGLDKLKELANCCGYMTLESVEEALKK